MTSFLYFVVPEHKKFARNLIKMSNIGIMSLKIIYIMCSLACAPKLALFC